MNGHPKLLDVQSISRVFAQGGLLRGRSETTVVDQVSFSLPADRPVTLAIAGESGSGKSTLAAMLLGFLGPSSGRIQFDGADTRTMNAAALANFRRNVQAVFQNPFDTFNPFYTVDRALNVVIRKFRLAQSRAEARAVVADALRVVRIDPADILGRRPHQLSGGQLQRIMIARALLARPRLIVADEPVSMIDASLRAIVLDVMASLKTQFAISQIYITHDLSSALQISDEIMILYRGSVVESGDAEAVIRRPRHPYTRLLVDSIPHPDPAQKWQGTLPPFVAEDVSAGRNAGCKFYARCPSRMPVCLQARPLTVDVGANQRAACHLYEEPAYGAAAAFGANRDSAGRAQLLESQKT